MLAVLRWDEPRETVDVTLLTGFVDEEAYVTALLARFEPRIDDAAAFACVNRVLLLRAVSGVGLDIALGGLPFEDAVVERFHETRPCRELMARSPLYTTAMFDTLLARSSPGGRPRRRRKALIVPTA